MKPIDEAPRRGRWVLVALAALFLSGLAGSFLLIRTGWLPSATKNYGELVQPARPVGDVALRDLEGQSIPFSNLQGKWTFVYFGSAECLRPCRDALYKMRQVTAAQGTEAHRVQSAFVVTDPKAIDLFRYTLKDYPDTVALRGTPDAVRELAAQFELSAGTPLDGLDRIYLVDPLGNFMMSYPADADPKGMLKDLKFLLRASQVG